MSSVSSEYIGYRLEVFIAVFIPIQLIAVALRFYARSLTVQKYDGGDWLISAALIGQLVAAGIAISELSSPLECEWYRPWLLNTQQVA